MRGTTITFVTGMSLVAYACGGGDDGPGPEPATMASAQGPCTQLCEAEIRCMGETDPLATCTAECQSEVDGWARQDALEVFADCMSGQSCRAAPDTGIDEDPCIAMISVLDVHRQWNTKCNMQLASCDAELAELCVVEGENGFVRLFSPVVVNEMLACLDAADCPTRLMCVEGVFTKYGIDG